MALGHYLWRNSDGTTVDVDVDALPKTSRPPNIAKPNVHIEAGSGRLMRCQVPNFYVDPATNLIYHSTWYPSSN